MMLIVVVVLMKSVNNASGNASIDGNVELLLLTISYIYHDHSLSFLRYEILN